MQSFVKSAMVSKEGGEGHEEGARCCLVDVRTVGRLRRRATWGETKRTQAQKVVVVSFSNTKDEVVISVSRLPGRKYEFFLGAMHKVPPRESHVD